MGTKRSISSPSRRSPADTMCLILFDHDFNGGAGPVGSTCQTFSLAG